MEAAHKRRLELLITWLVVGIVAGAAIIVVGAENALQGTSNGFISVLKSPHFFSKSSLVRVIPF
jgi:hypothetical protein